MNTRIDFHNHSNLSDGKYSITKICNIKKDILDTVCITDHYPLFIDAFIEGKKQEIIYNQNKTSDMPNLIIGMEFSFINGVEILIFGSSCIREVIKYVPKTYKEMSPILKYNFSASIICHPIRNDELENEFLLSMVDGIEITASGFYLKKFENRLKEIKEKFSLNLVSNSDFHSSLTNADFVHNIVKDYNITKEDELINTLKNKPQIENVLSVINKDTVTQKSE